jgi:hypothetical protein
MIFHYYRASGTVYTALDIATGQEVSTTIQFLRFSFIFIGFAFDGIDAFENWVALGEMEVYFTGVQRI